MIYYKNLETNQVIEFINEDSIGISFYEKILFKELTITEIQQYEFQKAKDIKQQQLKSNYQATKQPTNIVYQKSTQSNTLDNFIDLFTEKRLLAIDLQNNNLTSIEFTTNYEFIFKIGSNIINLTQQQLLSLQLRCNDIRRGYYDKYLVAKDLLDKTKTNTALDKIDCSIEIQNNIIIDSFVI